MKKVPKIMNKILKIMKKYNDKKNKKTKQK